MQVSLTTTVDRPVEEVFALMADVRNETRWNTQVSRAELLTSEPVAKGSRFMTVNRGQEYAAEIVEFLPDEAVTFEVTGKQMDITARMTFTGDGSTTRMHGTFELRPKGPMKLLLPVLGPAIRKDMPK